MQGIAVLPLKGEDYTVMYDSIRYLIVSTDKKFKLELKGIQGTKGWLLKDFDKVAFKFKNKFFIVDRKKLLNFALSSVETQELNSKELYRRWYLNSKTKQVSTYFFLKDLENLMEKVLEIRKR